MQCSFYHFRFTSGRGTSRNEGARYLKYKLAGKIFFLFLNYEKLVLYLVHVTSTVITLVKYVYMRDTVPGLIFAKEINENLIFR